ncbi:MAG: hypothetical protein WCZ87_05845, partial [Thiohalobacteraceae bacterium]
MNLVVGQGDTEQPLDACTAQADRSTRRQTGRLAHLGHRPWNAADDLDQQRRGALDRAGLQ